MAKSSQGHRYEGVLSKTTTDNNTANKSNSMATAQKATSATGHENAPPEPEQKKQKVKTRRLVMTAIGQMSTVEAEVILGDVQPGYLARLQEVFLKTKKVPDTTLDAALHVHYTVSDKMLSA
jgi:hypothetical protein